MKRALIQNLTASSIEFLRAQEGKPRRFRMIAYTGADVQRLFGRAVFDIAGIQAGGKVPILLDHDSGQRAGFADKVSIEDGSLVLEGTLSRSTDAGREISALSDEGFPWQASIGVEVTTWRELQSGETLTVNAREVSGPISVATESRLLESSFLMAGADKDTHAIALERNRMQQRLNQDPEGDDKGEEGKKGNGETARRLIKEAEDKGFTQEEIGDATNRSASVIGQIKSGDIKNPPDDLIDSLRKLVKKKSKKEEDMETRKELGEFLKVFPGREGWAASQFALGMDVTQAKAALSDVLLQEIALAPVPAPAVAPAPAAPTPTPQQALLAQLNAQANPGVGFDGTAAQGADDEKMASALLASLPLEKRCEVEWLSDAALRSEFANKLTAYIAYSRREAEGTAA